MSLLSCTQSINAESFADHACQNVSMLIQAREARARPSACLPSARPAHLIQRDLQCQNAVIRQQLHAGHAPALPSATTLPSPADKAHSVLVPPASRPRPKVSFIGPVCQVQFNRNTHALGPETIKRGSNNGLKAPAFGALRDPYFLRNAPAFPAATTTGKAVNDQTSSCLIHSPRRAGSGAFATTRSSVLVAG